MGDQVVERGDPLAYGPRSGNTMRCSRCSATYNSYLGHNCYAQEQEKAAILEPSKPPYQLRTYQRHDGLVQLQIRCKNIVVAGTGWLKLEEVETIWQDILRLVNGANKI